MKKSLFFLCAVFVLFSMSGIATAAYVFDFEDGTDSYGPLPGLEAYMEGIFDGNDITLKSAIWWGESAWYGSDILYTTNKSAVLDFDPLPAKKSDFEIQKLSFDWIVLDATNGIDFGLDVFDDFSGKWIDNYFKKTSGSQESGFTGLITFADELEITRLRIHDAGILDVGMDNLTLHLTPIPATVWIFGAGLMSLLGVRKKFKT